MPIDYKKYPPDWKERRARVLERDGYKCAFCGAPQYAVGYRDNATKRFIPVDRPPTLSYLEHTRRHWAGMGLTVMGERLTFAEAKEISDMAAYGDSRYLVIVLTVAHLDHDETNWNVKDERLAALCQRCHLRMDVGEKKRRRRKRQATPAELVLIV